MVKQLRNFVRIVAVTAACLPWLLFRSAMDYIGEAVDLAKEAWREADKL